jgi:PilZ domain
MCFASANFGVLPWEAFALVAIGGLAGGLAIALFMLLGRRSSSVEPVYGSGDADGPDLPPSPSRRAAPRRAGRHVDVLISDADHEAPAHQGWVIDRSAGGLALGSLHPAEVGTILSVRPLAAPDHEPWVQVEIRQCAELDHGSWRLGCKFVRTPPYSLMMLFG